MINLVIDRKKWLRGTKNGELKVPHREAYCCFGLLALACGAKKKDISGRQTPMETFWTGWPKGTVHNGAETPVVRELMSSNDNCFLDEKERERRIKKGMRALGVKVTFVGEGRPKGT